MTQALQRGDLLHADVDIGKASRLAPEGPSNFLTPRHQHSTSTHPNPANDTDRVRQNDPLAQREQPLFKRRSRKQIIAADHRLDQFGTLVWDIFDGPCLNSRAGDVVEQFVPFAAIACGQNGFHWMMEKVVARYAPHVSSEELDEIIAKTLPDPPRYNSAAIGKRWGVTVEQYDRLGLSHIWPAGWGKKRLDTHKRKRRNKKAKATRHATEESKTPRELSIVQLQPWTYPWAPCSSRPGFYRLPKADQDALVARARAEATMRR